MRPARCAVGGRERSTLDCDEEGLIVLLVVQPLLDLHAHQVRCRCRIDRVLKLQRSEFLFPQDIALGNRVFRH